MERFVFKVWSAVMARPRLYEWSISVGRLLQPFLVREGKIGRAGSLVSRILPPLDAWTSGRDLRPIAKTTFREQWRNELANKINEVKA